MCVHTYAHTHIHKYIGMGSGWTQKANYTCHVCKMVEKCMPRVDKNGDLQPHGSGFKFKLCMWGLEEWNILMG